MYLILSIILTVCAAIGFGYGLFRFFREGEALYVRMIVFAVGSAMFGRLIETLQLLVNGQISGSFHIGMLGTAGSFLFLFSANYGQMDSLVDDGSKQFRKTRIIALIAPIVMIAMWGVLASKGFTAKTAIIGIETLIIAMAAYYHLKHIIIKDVDFGLIRVIRNYNILALVYAFLCMAEILIKSFNLSFVFVIIVYVLQCAVMLAFVPVLERGVNKWTI